MHASLCFLAIALAGQLTTNNVGDRYGNVGPAAAPPAAAPAVGENPFPGQPFPDSVPPAAAPGQTRIDFSQAPSAGNTTLSGEAAPFSATPLAGATTAPQLKPSHLIRSFLEDPASGKLSGVPWSLAEVVQETNSREVQTRFIHAYWDLVAGVAKYHLTLDDVVQLKTLQGNIVQPGPQWREKLLVFETQVRVAGRSAKVAQHRLQQLMGRPSAEGLPLPSDVPLCGAYGTRYDEIFASRPSEQAGQLSKLLALNYQSIQDNAEGIASASQWLQSVDQTRRSNTDGQDLLRAYELLTLRRCAFVEAVRNYNVNIASYSQLATPGNINTGRLVAMLIPVKPDQRLSWGSQGVQPASAEQPLGGPPQTFVEGDRNMTRQAESPRQGVEHSILTSPKSGR